MSSDEDRARRVDHQLCSVGDTYACMRIMRDTAIDRTSGVSSGDCYATPNSNDRHRTSEAQCVNYSRDRLYSSTHGQLILRSSVNGGCFYATLQGIPVYNDPDILHIDKDNNGSKCRLVGGVLLKY